MSLKLKGIKIDSFRAFERQKYFDCVNPVFNEISNLIVLYAPNGTGKTSFFDAIEWSLTGEISRLNENKNVRDIASQERKYILKNKYSSAEVGSVELAFDDGSFYALTTKKLNGKQTTDYVEGNETKKTVDLTAKELKILRQKNLLTHNQIDAFLRSQSAEGRYDALSNFWDKENVSEDYKNLVLFVNEMNKALGQQETKMNQLTKEIEKLESNAKIWQTINQLKENYAKLNGKNSKKDPLLKNQLGLQELYIESNKLKSNNQIKLNQLEEERQQLENLITMIQEYRQIPQQIEWSEKQVADVNEKLAHLTEIETIEEKKKVLFDEKIDLSNHLKRCNFLINHEADFQAQEMAEQNSNREINEWINQRKKCEQALITLQKEHQEQEVTLSECQNKRALRTNQLTEIKELNSYSDVKAKRQLLDHEIKQQKKKKIHLEAKLGKIKLTLTKLFSLLNLDDHQLSQKDYSKDPDYSFLLEQTSQLDDIWQERKKLEVDLAQKKKERSSLEDLGSQLEQLKKLGYSIVTDTSSSVCPLCLHDHQEFQHIIQKIEASTADLLPIEQLTKEISHLEGMIDESTRRLTDVVSEVKQQIQIQITIKETEINQHDHDLLQVTLKLKQQEEAYLTNEKHWYKLNEYSQKYGIDCEKIAEETQKRVGRRDGKLTDGPLLFSVEAIKKMRQQAGIEKSISYNVRAKTLDDILPIVNKLQKSGLQPSGDFSMIEDMLRLRKKNEEQGVTISLIFFVLSLTISIVLALFNFYIKKSEFRFFKFNGFSNKNILSLIISEYFILGIMSSLLFLITFPLLSLLSQKIFSIYIVSTNNLVLVLLLPFVQSIIISILSYLLFLKTNPTHKMKQGDSNDLLK